MASKQEAEPTIAPTDVDLVVISIAELARLTEALATATKAVTSTIEEFSKVLEVSKTLKAVSIEDFVASAETLGACLSMCMEGDTECVDACMEDPE